MNYELIDFGNSCLPSILIHNILSSKKKHIFMRGMYSFNNICLFLEDGLLCDIYKKEYLTYENKPIEIFLDETQIYYHNSKITNTKYKFCFIHDFHYDISRNAIINYNFIMNQFNCKINNFKEICENNTLPIFINFSITMKKECIQIEKMLCILKNYTKKLQMFLRYYM